MKTDNVVGFQPAALIELTKMTPAELQNFLADQEHNGFDLAKLSVRNLSKTIKQWKNPAPQFRQIPQVLQTAANNADIQIEMNFSRAT